ncbi:MAG: hypothetical protein EP330_26755 [Deltaproteobacteria bacterium]|nr:MAG: hypothetical protein EP330_26755 [Deltaproteobacteria bacterium]
MLPRSLTLLALVACAPDPAAHDEVTVANPARTRAAEGRARLEASEAGQLILASIDAHGGLDAWYGSGALGFEYDYRPVSGTRVRRTRQTVDLLTARAVHEAIEPAEGVFAFDGEQAWTTLDPDPFPARFWALTPYYFVGLPFVLSDPGVHFELVDDDPVDMGLAKSQAVRVTFGEDIGDAPDDYYVVYVAESDKRLLATRYVVSYQPFFAGKEVTHSPEKLLVYSELTPVGPLTLPSRHTTYAIEDGVRGELVTHATVSDFEYGAVLDEAQLAMPEGAHLDTSLD